MKYSSLKRHHVLPLLFVLFLAILSISSYATVKQWVKGQAGGQTLEVSPPSQEVSLDPGKTVTVKATIRNKSNTPLSMTAHIEDFTASGEEGQVALSQNSEQYSVNGWSKVTPSTFLLGAQESQEVTATITAPKDAAGGRYGSFVFAVKPPEAAGNAAAVSQQIASLFLLRISGPVSERLILTKVESPSFQEFGPVPLKVRLENRGNVHVKAYGLINVTDMLGHKVADIVVPGTNVFPDAARIIEVNLNKTILIGPYTATALLYYGAHNDVLTAQTTFFMFPVRIAAALGVIVILLFLLRKRLAKALKAITRG